MAPDNAPMPGSLLDAHWLFLAFNGASVMVLKAYFDETSSHRAAGGIGITAVAGFLFDPQNLAGLHAEWLADPLIDRMPFPHASHCFAQRGKFQGFPRTDCDALMLRVNQLTAKFRGSGFACDLNDDEFKAWAAKDRKTEIIPNAYSMCVFGVLGMVRHYLSLTSVTQSVDYWFENGGPGQQDCDAMLRSIRRSDALRNRYRMSAYAFGCKESDPAFASADALAWEWQRNQKEATANDEAGVEDAGWRDTFKAFYSDESSPPIRHMSLGPRDFDVAYLEALSRGLRSG